MSPRKVRTVESLRGTLDTARDLLIDTRPKLAEAHERAENDTDDGLKPTSLQPPVSNGNSDPDLFDRVFTNIARHGEPDRWVSKRDEARETFQRLTASLDQAVIAARGAFAAASELCAISPELARKLLDAEINPSCANCSRVVLGGTDRIISGRCTGCYQYRANHGGLERPKELWDA